MLCSDFARHVYIECLEHAGASVEQLPSQGAWVSWVGAREPQSRRQPDGIRWVRHLQTASEQDQLEAHFRMLWVAPSVFQLPADDPSLKRQPGNRPIRFLARLRRRW